METSLARLSTFAAAHHGTFRRSDAIDAGIGPELLRSLVDRGWCERPWRSIYRVRGAPDTPDQRLMIAVWFGGDGAAGSHRAAARVWRSAGFGASGPEVTVPRGRSQRRSYGLVHGSLVLPARHVTVVGGIPVTTPARTIFDLAGVLPLGRTARVLDDALAKRLCTVRDVQQVFFVLAGRGRRGTRAMRTLLEERGEGYVPPSSELERMARETLARHGLPTPRFEVDLGDDDWIGRVDCVWQRERVIVELDGRRHHDSRLDRERDRVRDNRLMAAGYRVIRVTWDDLVQRSVEVVGWIRDALAAARPSA
jgi:very-short-patch-repair endonuclease